jgi:hypothetical protein
MKKIKYEILFIILFMTIGIAAVTTNIVINGSTPIASNPDDFNVYFFDISTSTESVKVDFTMGLDNSISFNTTLEAVGQKAIVIFDIFNASRNYDADVSITCTPSDEYLKITPVFNYNIIHASDYESGSVVVELLKSYAGDSSLERTITCSLNANAVERDTLADESIEPPEAFELVSFSIDDKTYVTPTATCWGGWVDSEYNTDNFSFSDGYLVNGDGDIVEFQEYGDNIESDRNYRLVQNFEYVNQDSNTGETFYSVTLSFYKGMTWFEWVLSDFNIDEVSFSVVGEYVYNGNYLKVGPKALDEIIKDYRYVVYYTL